MPWPAPLLRKNKLANKYDFGHLLVIAGSPTMLGAAALCAKSAYRMGAGLVTVGVAKSLNLTLQKKVTDEVMSWPLAQTRMGGLSLRAFVDISKKFNKYQAMAIGCGTGRESSTIRLILRLVLEAPMPMVVDADGLNALSLKMSVLHNIKGIRVLTPHEGEMSRLTGLSADYIQAHRLKVAKDFVKKYKVVLVLKGYHTIVADGKQVYVNKTGSVAMAKAGFGDVLTGMIGALLAQGVNPFESAKFAVYWHGQIAKKLTDKTSKAVLLAQDIIKNLKD